MIDVKKIIESQPVPTGFPADLQKELQSFEASNNPELTPLTEEEKQRTEQWHAERLGMFTGSRFKDLMTCKSRAKREWDNVEKILDFGDTAITYILERAIERSTGNRIETPETWQMRWGTYHEPDGKAFYQEKTGNIISECGFEKFYNCAGASPDGVVSDIYGNIKVFELKCPATIKSHFDLSRTAIDESHTYFWQLQGEMLSVGTNEYIFASYDPRYPDNAKLFIKEGVLSEVHVNALKARIIIAECVIKELIESNFKTWSIPDLPTNYTDFLTWLSEAEKPLLI